MLPQKQGARVRISSHDKVINMSDVYIPSESICSCLQCDSTSCFSYRNINSGLPCTCTDCDPNRCLTWPIKKDESKPNNETRIMHISPEMSKDSLSVPETKKKHATNNTKKYTDHPINTTNEPRKEKISFSNLDHDLQNNTLNDPELKEVFTKKEKIIGKCGTMEKLIENKNINDLGIKDTSSNENSEIIEFNAIHLEKQQPNDLETKQNSANDGSDTKIWRSKNKTSHMKSCQDPETQPSLTNYDFKHKELSSKIHVHLPQNESAYSDNKKLLTRKIRNCCSQKISTVNTKSDYPEVYEIFTNEKKNIIKCCNICKDLEEKYADTSENKQNNPENKIKCKDSKDVQNNKTATTESNLEINTTMKIRNIKCNHEHPIKDKTSDKDFGNYTKYTYKDVSHTRNKINMNKNNKSYEKHVSRLQSVAISYAHPDYENSRAALSAQIMNVPYEEFKDSLSKKQSPTDSHIYNSSTKLDKLDIFSRLKEIYKACSCKVCECLAGNWLFNRSEICNCRPCDCDDCNRYMAKLQKRINDVPHSGCPCVSCDRKDCRGVVKSTSNYNVCDCKPCDCIRCSESFSKPCSCAPCQCEQCKTSIFMPQTLMVANVAESLRQSNCDCDPCECTNCTSRYSAMTSNLMPAVSTGIITHGNCNCVECSDNACQLGRSDCRCDSQNKIIRKPMTEKKPDYGIHRVYIKEDKYEKTTKTNNNRNTITMFALSNNYPERLFKYSNPKKSCECDVCECIVCKDKGKGSIKNKSLKIKIEKPNCNFNTNPLNISECSPCACRSYKSLQAEKVKGKFCVETGYDPCICTDSKHFGYNFKIINNYGNYNLKRAKPNNSTFENNCMCNLRHSPESKYLVDVHSQNIIDTDEGYLHDNDKYYLFKKGTLLTPSTFDKNVLASDSSHIHIKPEKYSLREYDLRKKAFPNEQNTNLCRNKSHNNYSCNDYKDDINKSPKSANKVMSTNSSFMNIVSKEVGTNEIYKISSVDFKQGNISRVFFERSKSNVQNDSNTILLDADLTHMTPKQSTHCNKKLEYNRNINKCIQTPLLDKQEVVNVLINTKSSSNNDIHFSSAKSMSLVKLLCNERNLNIDNKNTRKFLQSLEKIPLKRLKMYKENESYICDNTLNDNTFNDNNFNNNTFNEKTFNNHTFNDDIFFDSSAKDNYSNFNNNNLLINLDQDKLDTLSCENKKLETGITEKKTDNYDVHDNNIVKVSGPKTTKQIKPKQKSNLQMVAKKPTNYNFKIKAKGSDDQPKTNKLRYKSKVVNGILRSNIEKPSKGNVNKVNNKRYLEIPDVINTASSAVNFTESDKRIDFEKSFKLLREGYLCNSENKKPSPILRKNFFFCSDVGKNKGICSSIPLLELDVNNADKSTSLQKNSIIPYCPGIGFGNKALAKLQTEVNEWLYSPLLQSTPTNSQTEKSESKSNLNSEINVSDAMSQTKRKNIIVDKEINCNMLESRDNLRHSIQNFINMTLTNVVQGTDETSKSNLIRDFNKVSNLNAAKINCDGLKPRFVGVKKVSDHSVLLKWTMPRDISNVQGYELQIDGRPVKKILNPSRCMAVLRCLPHCEKLLLTIRTIFNFETCHSRVTTIVYMPKKNKSVL